MPRGISAIADGPQASLEGGMVDSRYHKLLARRDHYRVAEKAISFLRAAEVEGISPIDLLRIGKLLKAIHAATGIDGCMPMSRKTIFDYPSWLGQWRSGELPFMALDASLYTTARTQNSWQSNDRAGSVLLAILGHEAGHEMMREGQKRSFIIDMGTWLAAKRESLFSEAQAWLFAGMLRAFVFADIGSSKTPDLTFMVV